MSGGYEPLPLRLRGTDPLHSWSASDHARVCADLVACSGMAPVVKLSIERLTLGAGDTATILHERSMLDSPCSVVVDGTNSGMIVTVPAGGRDAYGKAGGFRINGASYTLEGAGTNHTCVRIVGRFIEIDVLQSAGGTSSNTNSIGTLKIW